VKEANDFGIADKFMKLKLFILTLLFLYPYQAIATSVVTDFDISSSSFETKFVIKLSNLAEYKIFTLTGPDRLVIDIDNSSWRAGSPAIPSNSIVEKIRHGSPEDGKLRIVLDLDRPAKILNKKFSVANKKPFNSLSITISGGKSKEKEVGYKSNFPYKIPTFKPIKLKGYEKKSNLTKPDKPSKAPPIKRKPIFHKWVIVVDAGHGGVDPGAISKSGMQEKKITLPYELSLKRALEESGQYRVFLTRAGDYFVSLGGRVKKAQNANADLLISLHADSHPDSRTRGLSVYTLSERRAQWEANRIAKKARREEVIKGMDLSNQSSDVRNALIDLAQSQTKKTSASFAEILVKELGNDAKLLDRAHRFAGFAVLTGVDVPSVLVELGYLSNRQEEKLLRTSRYRVKLVRGIKDAVDKYFGRFD